MFLSVNVKLLEILYWYLYYEILMELLLIVKIVVYN